MKYHHAIWKTSGKWAATAVLSLTVLSGCSGGGGTPTASPTVSDNQVSEENKEEDGPYAKHLDIKWIGHNQVGKVNDSFDNPVKKLIEEKFNVTITMVPLDVHNQEQVNLYFADGETADHIQINVPSNFLIEQNLVREIPEDTMRRLMPSWMQALESLVDPEIVANTMKFRGKLYTVPFFNAAGTQSWVMGVRKDWLDNVGIDKLPETQDEYYEMLKRFTFNDPDQNGKDDTYGGHGLQLYLRGAYNLGTGMGFYADDNGKVYANVLSDQYKEYLKTIQLWYSEGLIDPESITDERPQQRAKWAEGKFGVLADHPWWYAASTPSNVTQMVVDNNDKAVITFLKPFTGPDGDSGAGNIKYPAMAPGVYFGKDTSDEKMERIMAIKEHMSADEKFYARAFFGEEGVGYERNEDGVIIRAKEYLGVDKITEEGIGQYFAVRPLTWDFVKNNTTEKKDLPPYEIALAGPHKYDDVNFPAGGINESLLKHRTAVDTIVKEFETNVMIGRVDIDKEWDAYKDKFLKAGGQAIIDEYQQLHDANN